MLKSKLTSKPFFLYSLLTLSVTLGAFVPLAQAEEPTTPQAIPGASAHAPQQPPPFATVGDQTIPAMTYVNAVREGVKKKFYHGSTPRSVIATFQREIGTQLVEELLLLKEIKQRGIKPNQEALAKQIAVYDARYADAPRWKANRLKMIPGLTKVLAKQDTLEQLEKMARTIADPPLSEIQDFYDKNPGKFTKPKDQKLSLILLKVDPTSGSDIWRAVLEEAEKLVTKLRNGADFAELARIHSGDVTADAGGRMESTHKGTLAPEVEKALEKIQPGEVSDPITLLEGIAIFRVESRTPPEKITFEKAKERAKELLMREQSQSTWEKFKKQLWEKGQVSINEAYYIPLEPSNKEAEQTKTKQTESKHENHKPSSTPGGGSR